MSQLFDLPPKPRAAPRKLMHVIDAGDDQIGESDCMAIFACKRCGYRSDWLSMRYGVAKRGVPCPKCNGEQA